MNEFTFSVPQNIIEGRGSLAKLPEVAEKSGGKKAFIISGPHLNKMGIVQSCVDALKAKGIENLDYIVVLGCQVKGTKPSKALKDRLDTAKEYMQANPETIAVLSGGQGKMEEISEAECMRRYLEKAGISRERLILEQRSTTTRQNLRYSRRYMDYRHDEIGIITNNFHVYRSVLLARRSGYQRVCGIAAPCKSVLLYHYLVREAFALAREMLHKR